MGEVYARGTAGRSIAIAHPNDSPCDRRGCCSGVLGRPADGKRLADIPVGSRPPWFHHCPSNPLSTVIMAMERLPRSLWSVASRSGGLSRGGGAVSGSCGDGWATAPATLPNWASFDSTCLAACTTGERRSSSGSASGSTPRGEVEPQGKVSSPSLNREGTSGRVFQTWGASEVREVDHRGSNAEKGMMEPSRLVMSQGLLLTGAGAEWPRS